MFGFKPLSRKNTIIITIVSFVVLIGLICLYVFKLNEKWLMVLIMIMSVVSMVSLNSMISKLIVFKPRKQLYPKGYYEAQGYEALEAKLNKAGFKMTSKQYGSGYIKIEGKTAYKVILIENDDRYFNQGQSNDKPTKGIDKCEEFIGFEFFLRPTEASLKRLPDFSFTGDNVFYTGFYFDSENNMLVEANKIDPKLHNDSYLHLKEMLGLKEVEAPVINNRDKKRKNK